jgi:hypothetical protein
LRQSYIPPRPSVKTHSKITQGKKNSKGKNKSKDRGVFFALQKGAPQTPRSTTQNTTISPSNHHTKQFLFPKPPQKIRQKNGKPPHGPYQDFFAKPHHPPAHPAVITADKDA